jgi:hypothetical protein
MMEPYLVFFLVLGVVIIGGTLSFATGRKIRIKRQETILQSFRELLPLGIVSEEEKRPFQFRIDTEKKVYLVKVVVMNPQHELIVTNPDFWCVNSDPRSWNRASAPELIAGVREFRDCFVKTDKKIIKVGLLFPGCSNVTRYQNESDVEMVKFDTDVFGTYLVQFDSLKAFFTKVGK